MKAGDIVIFIDHETGMPGHGQVLGSTKKRVRVVRRVGSYYQTILRAPKNLQLFKAARKGQFI